MTTVQARKDSCPITDAENATGLNGSVQGNGAYSLCGHPDWSTASWMDCDYFTITSAPVTCSNMGIND